MLPDRIGSYLPDHKGRVFLDDVRLESRQLIARLLTAHASVFDAERDARISLSQLHFEARGIRPFRGARPDPLRRRGADRDDLDLAPRDRCGQMHKGMLEADQPGGSVIRAWHRFLAGRSAHAARRTSSISAR